VPTNLSEFRQHVMPSAPKVPTIMVDKVVKDAIVEFAKRSHRMQVDITPINVVAGTNLYSVPNPTGFQIHAVSRLFHDGAPLHSVSENQLDLEWNSLNAQLCICSNEASDQWRQLEADAPVVYYQPKPNEVRLVATPSFALTAGLTGRVVVYPLLSMTAIDDDIYNEHYEAIASGALARLFATPSQPWSSPALVEYHRAMFEEGISDARGRVVRGFEQQNAQHLRTTAYA
jgi:hypothetical protein